MKSNSVLLQLVYSLTLVHTLDVASGHVGVIQIINAFNCDSNMRSHKSSDFRGRTRVSGLKFYRDIKIFFPSDSPKTGGWLCNSRLGHENKTPGYSEYTEER